MRTKDLTEKLKKNHSLSEVEYRELMSADGRDREELFALARDVQCDEFGNRIYMRGLIELTNHCRNDCLYCGIRKSNGKLVRYRLTEEDVLDCCRIGHDLGFRTFVIQGGEDPWYNVEKIEKIIINIKDKYPDDAVTLSLGEADRETYERWFKAGADRYLLRHETASEDHYGKLHPKDMLLSDRLECLRNLRDTGYQTGTGFMVGSPFQTDEDLAKDLKFIERFKPQMVGIGPFISHMDTDFAQFPNGSVEKVLILIAILRLIDSKLLLPATTALGSLSEDGRERGIMAGANVVMPNISPPRLRKLYSIYDNKITAGAETLEGLEKLKEKINNIGYELVTDRGDYQ